MKRVVAGTSLDRPPEWAILQRRLFDLLDDAAEPFLERENLFRPDGSVRWPHESADEVTRPVDNSYEALANWPLYYALGGDESYLDHSLERWEAITSQYGPNSPYGHHRLVDEFDPSGDWFHLSEGNLYLYYVGLADPDNERFSERVTRFADLYLPDGPGNFDPERTMVRSPINGAAGPTIYPDDTYTDAFPYQSWQEWYGLPFQDIDGCSELTDLQNPDVAERMGRAMDARTARGDVPMNLAITTLMTAAYLHTGEECYREWVFDYVDAWRDHTVDNDGIVPDNVGLSGEIGEHIDGTWYGGYYGWTWPHGWMSLGQAVLSAAENAVLLGSDEAYLSFPRSQVAVLREQGIERDGTLYVPYKHGDEGWYGYSPFLDALTDERGDVLFRDGWFEFVPMRAFHLVHLWAASMREDDADWVEDHHDFRRAASERRLRPRGFYRQGQKDLGGHEAAWAAYLRGEYPSYPEDVLAHGHFQVYRRLQFVRADEQDPRTYHNTYLQWRNPITVEGLVQTTMGGPMPVYNAGLLLTRVRHFDPERERPGLPPGVAALVSHVDDDRTTLELCNLSAAEREVVVQAGAFGEHRFGDVTCDVGGETRCVAVEDAALCVRLPVATRITLDLETQRFENDPTYAYPWAR